MTTVEGFESFADEVRAFGDALALDREQVVGAIDRGMGTTAREIADVMREDVAVDTGATRESITVEHVGPMHWRITAGEAAVFLEFGTESHVIVPDDAEALRFEVGGETVFAQRVNHPGTPPQPFFRPAFDRGIDNLEANIMDELEAEFADALG